jgi:phosphoacetylglucosamine mutase
VGDAICNLLMIESVLLDNDFSIKQFFNLYADLPNKTLKATVQDRSAFKTTWDESRLVQPEALQQFIDGCCEKLPNARCFVRPSGTEDILRVYVEASTPAYVTMLANWVTTEIKNNYFNYTAKESRDSTSKSPKKQH